MSNSTKKPTKEYFKDLMQGVKPLNYTKVPQLPPKPQKVSRSREEIIEDPLFEFSDFEHLPSVYSEDKLEYARSGLQHKILRNLRLGYYTIEATLDLHGQTVAEAREALSKFLLQCQQHQLRHVLIIHGKGRINTKPILKNKLNHWLRQTKQVIAYCSAAPKHGQHGAVYVLLRRASLGK